MQLGTSEVQETASPSTIPPISQLSSNDFAGKTLDETNAFVREHEDALIDIGASPRQFYDRDMDGKEDVEEATRSNFARAEFSTRRRGTWLRACLLAMFFEDFVDEDGG
ncbi:hypothetical protein K438DRAFT_1978035 [Mycena galopus ATCC 62051]|nr:hypothetical protein K438DRAFT_1978035 [Mycena galopus ATCC 62051]